MSLIDCHDVYHPNETLVMVGEVWGVWEMATPAGGGREGIPPQGTASFPKCVRFTETASHFIFPGRPVFVMSDSDSNTLQVGV